MNKVVEVKGKQYLINTTPKDSGGRTRPFSEILELSPLRATGVVASVIEEITGQKQYMYGYLVVSDDDLVDVTLELGHKFSTARAWKNLFDWAYLRNRRQEKGND